MTGALDGLKVVVTRPRQQSGEVIALLQSAGAYVIPFPTLAIEALEIDAAHRARLTPDAHDWTIYTSANAVEHALLRLARPGVTRVGAVGRATARALETHGIKVHAVPAERASSEALLELPEFSAMCGKRVLIVRGAGGRDWLRDEFEQRGATVTIGEVYARVAIIPDAAAVTGLLSALRSSPCPVVSVTSVEVLDALLQMLPEDARATVRCAPLLLPGRRVASAALERHWHGPIIVSVSAEDAAMIEALVDWHVHGGSGSA